MKSLDPDLVFWVAAGGTTLAGLILWIRHFSTDRRKEHFIASCARVRWGFLDVLLAGFLYLSTTPIVLSVWNAVHAREEAVSQIDYRLGVFDGILKLALVAGLLDWFRRRYAHRPAEFGLSGSRWLPGILAGLKCFAMWIPLVWILQGILSRLVDYQHRSLDQLASNPEPGEVAAIWFATLVVAPVAEEFLFRVVIQGWFQRWQMPRPSGESLVFGERRGNPEPPARETHRCRIHWPSILATSVLFGLAHFSNGPAPVTLFVYSVGAGYLYQRTGSLVACVVVHFLLNFVTIGVFTPKALQA